MSRHRRCLSLSRASGSLTQRSKHVAIMRSAISRCACSWTAASACATGGRAGCARAQQRRGLVRREKGACGATPGGGSARRPGAHLGEQLLRLRVRHLRGAPAGARRVSTLDGVVERAGADDSRTRASHRAQLWTTPLPPPAAAPRHAPPWRCTSNVSSRRPRRRRGPPRAGHARAARCAPTPQQPASRSPHTAPACSRPLRRRVEVGHGRGRRVRHLPQRVRGVLPGLHAAGRRLPAAVGHVQPRVPPALHRQVARGAGGQGGARVPAVPAPVGGEMTGRSAGDGAPPTRDQVSDPLDRALQAHAQSRATRPRFTRPTIVNAMCLIDWSHGRVPAPGCTLRSARTAARCTARGP